MTRLVATALAAIVSATVYSYAAFEWSAFTVQDWHYHDTSTIVNVWTLINHQPQRPCTIDIGQVVPERNMTAVLPTGAILLDGYIYWYRGSPMQCGLIRLWDPSTSWRYSCILLALIWLIVAVLWC